jgi:hypothetical protein
MGLYPAFAIQLLKPMFQELFLISGKLFQALIKIYVRLVIAQSIQLSNIVLVDFHPLTRFSRYGSYSLQVMHDPEAPPTQCSTPGNFL